MAPARQRSWGSFLLALGDILLQILTLGAYSPSGDTDQRQLSAGCALIVVAILALLFLGAWLTGYFPPRPH